MFEKELFFLICYIENWNYTLLFPTFTPSAFVKSVSFRGLPSHCSSFPNSHLPYISCSALPCIVPHLPTVEALYIFFVRWVPLIVSSTCVICITLRFAVLFIETLSIPVLTVRLVVRVPSPSSTCSLFSISCPWKLLPCFPILISIALSLPVSLTVFAFFWQLFYLSFPSSSLALVFATANNVTATASHHLVPRLLAILKKNLYRLKCFFAVGFLLRLYPLSLLSISSAWPALSKLSAWTCFICMPFTALHSYRPLRITLVIMYGPNHRARSFPPGTEVVSRQNTLSFGLKFFSFLFLFAMIEYDVPVLSITPLTRCWIAPILSSPCSTAAEIEKGVLQGNSPAAGWLRSLPNRQ